MTDCKKTYLSDERNSALPDAKALEKINALSRGTLRAEDVYIFPVRLCDNEIDRDFDRLSVSALETLAKLYNGKTGIFDHDMRADRQCARIYDTQLVTDDSRVTSCGEPYTYLRASAFIPRIPAFESLIGRIDSGMLRETSIHCAARSVCSVCGADRGECAHRVGETYDGKRCHRILCDVTDVYEWSFVPVPAQREAGVLKSYTTEDKAMQDILKAVREEKSSLTLDAAALDALRAQLDTLENEARAGRAYKAHLTAEAIRCGAAAMPAVQGACLERICDAMTTEDLQTFCKGLREAADAKLPLHAQLAGAPAQTETENNAFMI